MKQFLLFIILPLWVTNSYAQNIGIEVNVNVEHRQGGKAEFEREKYIGIHAGIRENDWTKYGDANPLDIKNDFLNERNVFLGRNTGTITWNINSVLKEDANRPGFVDLDHLRTEATRYRNQFSGNADFVNYIDRNNDFILAAQHHPFYPDGKLTNKGWALSQNDTEDEPFGTASGEYCAHFIKEFYDNGSEQTPKYFEVINEPIYGQFGCEDCGETDEAIEEIFKYHNSVATEVKKVNPSVMVGGFTTAFPNFDYDNFQRWEKRWNKFMDMCGENMDFWSIHLYDWPEIRNKRLMRRGSRVEATLDMIEHASKDKFGVVKPILVSEYGCQVHTLINKTWSRERDWHLLRSYISMAMTFMDRPQHIAKALPFIVVKATWGTQSNGSPYNTRLLRKEGEPESSDGDWIYTELVRFYDFWKDVNGTKVDITTSNVDIQTLATVDGNRVYVVLNNLNRNSETIDLNIKGYEGNNLQSVNIKHLFGRDGIPVFDQKTQTTAPTEVTLFSESAMVLEYVFENDILIDETSEETKYYANRYYLPINGTEEAFEFSDVNTAEFGEAVLRIGIGRGHQLSKQPVVKVNGTQVAVPTNVRGELQEDRDGFFGVLEIPVPYELLSENNTVTVNFPDTGGHISSINMRVYNFSSEIKRFEDDKPITSIDDIKRDNLKVYPNPTKGQIKVYWGEQTKEVKLSIYSLQGQLVDSKLIQPSALTNTINLEQLEAGFYLLSFEFNGKVINKKLFIE
ncbi:T9SS type A sorting domain-containing protein [Flammeovirga aprica]|uniref:T9SS type A sorting domain-containing protein n=1 Tax=Flammeovirga aprica JL-4 TaxID=694437 RepID=A0A7X9RUA6_9BACT|nr:T9SS type A sorting domain-containing protein [Flammeovirga aprica]NME68842.1 T9SS type A sorting domain-containing protein [Flammeovirga aprica JL-4]